MIVGLLDNWENHQSIINGFNERLSNKKTNPTKAFSALKQHWKLSDEEALAFLDYKFEHFTIFNRLIAQSELTIPCFLSSAIKKLPKSQVQRVYRHDFKKLFDFVSIKDSIGKCFKLGKFLSTSAKKKFGDTYNFIIEILLQPHSTGIDAYHILTIIGLKENEKEVLFPPDCILKIVSFDKEKLILEETSNCSNSMLDKSIFLID